MSDPVRSYLEEHLAVAGRMSALLPQVEAVAQAICRSLEAGGRVYAFGNGGSAADAQHFTAELVGRYRRERRPLPAVALTTDPSAVTCIGNDYAFADLFARQVEGLVRPGDAVVGITTSGNSENVLRGLEAARRLGAVTVALTGGTGGRVRPLADHALVVPSATTARIQEMHILMIHMICERIDDWALAGRQQA